MSQAYSNDLRGRVLTAVKEGQKINFVSQVFKVCTRTIYRWLDLQSKTGSYQAKTGFQKGHSHKIKDLAAFKDYAEKHADLTLEELAELWGDVGRMTVQRALKKIGFTRKKNQLRLHRKARKRQRGISTEN